VFLIWPIYVSTADRASHITSSIADLNDLINALLDAESSARGFLLSGDERILRHFRDANSAAETMRQELLKSKTDFAGQENLLTELETTSDQKLGSLREAIARSRTDERSRTASTATILRDEELVARIRELGDQAEEHLQRSLQGTRKRGRDLVRLSQFISAFGCVGIFGIVLLSSMRIHRLGAARLRLNDELALANEDLRQFVYSASHDLQEPLRQLMLYADLIDKNLKGQHGVENELSHLRSAAKQMRALVVDLLSYTEVVSETKSVDASSDLNLIVKKAIESLRPAVEETKAEFSLGQLPVVRMAESQAHVLFQNLLSNSLKYRKKDVAPRVTISAQSSEGEWVISVADNGIGVEPAYHQVIFGIFKRLHTRTAYPGTGLGLAICRKIVERYGGAIWVESEPGSGSTFRFSVPSRT
jgi:signal transduction histidine kinase